MRRRIQLLGLSLVVIGVGASACSRAPDAPAAPRAVRAVSVTAAIGASGASFSGALEPRRQVNLAFRAAGRVALLGADPSGRRPLQEGDRVRAGQLIAALDEHDFRLQVNAAAASSDAAAAQVASAESALAQATTQAERTHRLFEASSVTKAELEKADAALATARSGLEAARAQHRARLEQEALARQALTDARLVSPIDGVVARRSVEPGESVSPGIAVASVIDTTEMRLVVGVPDTRINALRLGQPVPVRVNALPGVQATGILTKIAPTADPALRSFAVEVTVPNDGSLRSGMVASAQLAGSTDAARLRVPLSAVVRDPAARGFAVYVVDQTTAKVRPVDVEDLDGNDVVVTAGLQAGERVVSEGAQLLASGDRIQVMP